jgi:KaiC/GvpD/RAD55 family RecA-like ATPase
MPVDTTQILQVLRAQRPWIERNITGVAMVDRELATEVLRKAFIYDPETLMYSDCFAESWVNLIWKALSMFWNTVPETLPVKQVPLEFVLSYIEQNKEGHSQQDLEMAKTELPGMLRVAQNSGYRNVWCLQAPLVLEWLDMILGKRVQDQILVNAQGGAMPSHRQMVGLVDAVPTAATGGVVVDIDDVLFGARDNLRVLRLLIPGLHACMGEAPLYMKTSTLIAAGKGCGKTVLATQALAEAIKYDVPVLFITTEESGEQLMPRLLANMLSYDYGKLRSAHELNINQSLTGLVEIERKQGILPKDIQNNPLRLAEVQRLAERMRKNACMVEWTSGSLTVEDHIHAEYARAVKKLGRQPRLVIFDWVGGALKAGNPDHIRHKYNAVVNTLTQLAKDEDLHAMAMAQLDIKTLGKPLLGMKDLSESKSMSDNVNNFIAITGVYNPDFIAKKNKAKAAAPAGPSGAGRSSIGGNNVPKNSGNSGDGEDNMQAPADEKDDVDRFDVMQFFCCDKCRYGIPRRSRVRRMFHYQRFADPAVSGKETGFRKTPKI